MKAIVLAGGYAKRLWPLTKELAKPMVDINGRPIVSYILDKLEQSQQIEEIIISTNAKFHTNFQEWLDTQEYNTPIKLVVEPSKSEGEKLGAIGGLHFVLQQENISDDVFVIGGDNLVSLNVGKILSDFTQGKEPVVGVFDIKDKERIKNTFGEVTVDQERKVTRFREKPEEPETSLLSTCCYVFPAGIHKDVATYLSNGHNKDAPGFFFEWLVKNKGVRAHIFDEYWFDIGDHRTLEKARQFAKDNNI